MILLPSKCAAINLSDVVSVSFQLPSDKLKDIPNGYVNFRNGTHLAIEPRDAMALTKLLGVNTLEDHPEYFPRQAAIVQHNLTKPLDGKK